jgi:hypothetical protein
MGWRTDLGTSSATDANGSNGQATGASISAGGPKIAFVSEARNLEAPCRLACAS